MGVDQVSSTKNKTWKRKGIDKYNRISQEHSSSIISLLQIKETVRAQRVLIMDKM